MYKWIKENKWFILIFLAITLLYFIIRLPQLTLQPIFADEAIYIRWSQIMKAEATLRFLPLSDGKTPLYMWVLMPMLKFIPDPLFAGRLLSILAGYITLTGVFFLGWRFFNKSIGLWSAFLCAVTPFMFFFDRMALVDSMLTAFAIWGLNVGLILVNNPRLDLAMIFGFLLGGGLLAKTPAMFNILTIPTTLIVFKNWKNNRQTRLVRIFIMWVVAGVISMVIYNMLRLGPGFSNLNSRNQDYVLSPTRILERPWDPFVFRVRDLYEFLLSLYGVPLIIILLIGVFMVVKNKNKYGIAIIIWSLIPLVIVMASLKTLTARYILFMITPWLVIAGYGIWSILDLKKIKKHLTVYSVGFVILLSIWPVYFWVNSITNPEKVPLAHMERRGYLEDWTAGYGLREIAQMLMSESKDHKIIVGTEGSFGTLPDGVQIYFDKNSNVIFIGGKGEITPELQNAALTNEPYFIANRSRFLNPPANLVLIKEYPRPIGKDIPPDTIQLFEIKPINQSTVSAITKN